MAVGWALDRFSGQRDPKYRADLKSLGTGTGEAVDAAREEGVGSGGRVSAARLPGSHLCGPDYVFTRRCHITCREYT